MECGRQVARVMERCRPPGALGKSRLLVSGGFGSIHGNTFRLMVHPSYGSAVRATRNGAAVVPFEMKSKLRMGTVGKGFSQVSLKRRIS